MITAARRRIEQIRRSEKWFFKLFHGDDIPKPYRIPLSLSFTAGCVLIASGNEKTGMFICVRSLNQVVGVVSNIQTKVRQVVRFLPTNPERFARCAASSKEINDAFAALDHQDEVLDE